MLALASSPRSLTHRFCVLFSNCRFSFRYQFDPRFSMFACKEILPELIARFEALDEVRTSNFITSNPFSYWLFRMGVVRWM